MAWLLLIIPVCNLAGSQDRNQKGEVMKLLPTNIEESSFLVVLVLELVVAAVLYLQFLIIGL